MAENREQDHDVYDWEEMKIDFSKLSGLSVDILDFVRNTIRYEHDLLINIAKEGSNLKELESVLNVRTAYFYTQYSWVQKVIKAGCQIQIKETELELAKSKLSRLLLAKSAKDAMRQMDSGIAEWNESIGEIIKNPNDVNLLKPNPTEESLISLMHFVVKDSEKEGLSISESFQSIASRLRLSAMKQGLTTLRFLNFKYKLRKIGRFILKNLLDFLLGFLIVSYLLGKATSRFNYDIPIVVRNFSITIPGLLITFILAFLIYILKKSYITPLINSFIEKNERKNWIKMIDAFSDASFGLCGITILDIKYFLPEEFREMNEKEKLAFILNLLLNTDYDDDHEVIKNLDFKVTL